MLTTNKKNLVRFALKGEITLPVGDPYEVDTTGKVSYSAPAGGINYDFKLGDSCYGMKAIMPLPGVAAAASNSAHSSVFKASACIGNEVKVLSGEAKGSIGTVIGKSMAGVAVKFDDEVLEKLVPGDGLLIKANGIGLEVEGHPELIVANCSPEFFDKLNITEENGRFRVPVTCIVPKQFKGGRGVGGRFGMMTTTSIMVNDFEEAKKYGLDKLRVGDIVLLEDFYSDTGHSPVEGAVTIGVVCTGDSVHAGCGPMVLSLVSSFTPVIEGIVTPELNIKDLI